MQQKLNETLKLPEITGKDWGEDSLRKFEPTLPVELRKDLNKFFLEGKRGQEDSSHHRKESNDESVVGANTNRQFESMKVPFSQSSSSNLLRQNTNNAPYEDDKDDDDFFRLREELEKGAEQEEPQREKEGSVVDRLTSHRQRVRFVPVTQTVKPSPYENQHNLHRFPSAHI